MEGSDRKACAQSEAQQGSDDATDALQCEQCHDNGRFEVASAFCSNCTDYLCTDCVKQHRIIRRLKDHIILEGEAMPRKKPTDAVEVECPEHRGKLIELYCHSDSTLACVLCIAESHRTCSDVTSISKLAAGLGQSRELRDVKMSARKQKKLLGSYRKVIDEYRILNGCCYDKTVEGFETFKSKIEAGLDLLGKRVYREGGEVKQRNEKKLNSLSESLKPLEQKLESQMSDIMTKEAMKKMDQLFIAIKNNASDIVENRQKIDEMKKELHIETYTFGVDPMIQHILDKMVSTNPIKVLSGDVECSAEIDVKETEDSDCGITDLVEISPTEILAVDCKNKCLKSIDIDKKTVSSRRTLSASPRNAAVIPGTPRVAVTLHEIHEIHYFDTQKQLAPCGSVHVDGDCVGIRFTADTLIVSFVDPGKVEIMDFEGHVKKTFTTDSRDTPLFNLPLYLSLSPDHTDIYVSDIKTGVVTCLSMTGLVNWKYTGKHMIPWERDDTEDDEGLEDENNREDGKEHDNGDVEEQDNEDEHENDAERISPAGLTIGTDGCLYVCSHKTRSIHVVSPAGTRLRIIPVAECGVQGPLAICYSKMQGSLYVSRCNEDFDFDNSIRRLSFK